MNMPVNVLNIRMMVIGLSNIPGMSMDIEGTGWRGHLWQSWLDCDKNGMKSFGISFEDVQDRDDWRVRIKEANQPGLPGKHVSLETTSIWYKILSEQYWAPFGIPLWPGAKLLEWRKNYEHHRPYFIQH